MPVSKKPRRGTKTSLIPTTSALPDRAAMERFLATLGGRRGDTATERAQDLVYDAWEETRTRTRLALARKALGISPLCADAFNLLAEEVNSPLASRDLYARALEAAELALGPEAFQGYAGQFWGFLETRPYMRAKAGLANALRQLGDEETAIHHYREMLKLNPDDNQGIRYILASCLLKRSDHAALKDLLATYPDEASTCWLYTQALLVFRERGGDATEAIAIAEAAWTENQHVPAILAGTRPPVFADDGSFTAGGPDEATFYFTEFGLAWHSTPGAVQWLIAIAADLSRVRPTVH